MMDNQEVTTMDSTGKTCKVCGEQCEEIATHKHNRVWICRDCGVKYFDRDKSEYAPYSYVERTDTGHGGRHEYEYKSDTSTWG